MEGRQSLKLITYNCKHFTRYGPKFDFLYDIVNKGDIILAGALLIRE